MKNVTFLLPLYYEKKSIENFLNCIKEINNSIGKYLHFVKKYGVHALHEIKQNKSPVIKK